MILQGEITSYPEMCAEHGVPRSASAPASSVSAFFTTLSGQCARVLHRPHRHCIEFSCISESAVSRMLTE